jgi:D-galactarolactone isomerase
VSQKRAKLTVPAGAVDTHMHVYHAEVPPQPGGPPLPGDFREEKYRAMRDALRFQRVVVVQPNAYQFDNTVTLKAMKALGPGAKGIAVVNEKTPDAEIEQLSKAGMVGQRFFQMQWGAVGFERMHAVMARVHPFGWLANLQLDGRELPKWEGSIKKLPGKFIVDHIGKFLEPVTVDSAPFQSLLHLLDTGRCWVKLSGAYETSKTGAPKYEDVSVLSRALVKHAPERMLWASNWPHPSAPKDKVPDDADLLDLLLDWAPDEAIRKKILVDNAANLYGFPI